MTFSGGSQRAFIAFCVALLAIVYAIAWLTPAVGLYRDDATSLITAKALWAGHGYTIDSLPAPVPQTQYPPLFPALLALFLLVSKQTQWLKLLPLLCAAGWFAVTFRLLRKMGASKNGALTLVILTAVSPTVVFLATSLFSEALFALLVAACLLMLLEDRPLLAGALAGLATLTSIAGATLIVACILTLVIRRRLGSALRFTAVAMVLVAPWLGWSLARGATTYTNLNIVTSLPANEKAIVLAQNLFQLLLSPLPLLTGLANQYAVIGVVAIFGWCMYVRRQLLPDLFVGFYCLMLLCRISPPARPIAPILPLILWIAWRVVARVRIKEAVAAFVLILGGAGLWSDGARIPKILAAGAMPLSPEADAIPPDNWREMAKLYAWIRDNTAPSNIVAGNLDGALFLNTGRKAIRGYAPHAFGLLYAEKPAGITPDELSGSVLRDQADYVVLTPDHGYVEAPSFRSAVVALERGGVLQPVVIPGISPEYRLLRAR